MSRSLLTWAATLTLALLAACSGSRGPAAGQTCAVTVNQLRTHPWLDEAIKQSGRTPQLVADESRTHDEVLAELTPHALSLEEALAGGGSQTGGNPSATNTDTTINNFCGGVNAPGGTGANKPKDSFNTNSFNTSNPAPVAEKRRP